MHALRILIAVSFIQSFVLQVYRKYFFLISRRRHKPVFARGIYFMDLCIFAEMNSPVRGFITTIGRSLLTHLFKVITPAFAASLGSRVEKVATLTDTLLKNVIPYHVLCVAINPFHKNFTASDWVISRRTANLRQKELCQNVRTLVENVKNFFLPSY